MHDLNIYFLNKPESVSEVQMFSELPLGMEGKLKETISNKHPQVTLPYSPGVVLCPGSLGR